jgi:hypothetical protein
LGEEKKKAKTSANQVGDKDNGTLENEEPLTIEFFLDVR